MSIPAFQPALNGILNHGGIEGVGGGWSTLIAPDGSGSIIRIDPSGVVSYISADHVDPYSQFIVSGMVASIMPLRAGGPLPNAKWWNYGLIQVPTSGL